ncbi:MAG: hypothetical protein MPEBLZ_01975 [Candidatus Methanoperedens nitroreducens]|uniref:Uncharacterized protein n=1 Tax=Candidatus Methanoperedens nitratireducens TaxID=1392998 RepID=A0A0N8KQY9_9EURY|nr:MAG: hypothetical protein MPEBLZ_01975 [Candidatus Methanoperedens sp. BLZ1]CAG0989824.1 hypothetical protein METP2_02507 [Methanosarcinales archaeon]
MRIAVKAKKYNKSQMNADKRRFVCRIYLGLIHINTPQRTRRTQSLVAMFFANFAFFAVKVLQFLTELPENIVINKSETND